MLNLEEREREGMGIPVVDMKDATNNLPEKIVKAAEEWGCFRVINHGIPAPLMTEMKALSRSFHDLPLDIKMTNFSPQRPDRGYLPLNRVSPFMEGFTIHGVESPAAIPQFCAQLLASPYQTDVLLKYGGCVHALAMVIGGKIMEGFGVKKDDLFNGWSCQLRLNRFNYDSNAVGKSGLFPHSDPGFLTILQDDDFINGLQVQNKFSGDFIPADPIPGSFLVNTGDVATAWSNGRFCNVKHRVQCHQPNKIRTSIALFVLAPKDEKVAAPPELVGPAGRRYVPFEYEEYKNIRNSTRSVTGEALHHFLHAPKLMID